MTRINVVPPEELAGKFLVSEYKEIVRVFSLARKAQYEMHKVKQPKEYSLGTGHVKFFYDKLGFVSDRYDSLCKEMQDRGYVCNRVPKEELLQGIQKFMLFGYTATQEALALNRARIKERIKE